MHHRTRLALQSSLLALAASAVLASPSLAQDAPPAQPVAEPEAPAIQTEALPPRHERTATTMVALGRLLADQKRVAEAEPLLREALSIRRHQLVPGSWQIAQAESELGGVLAMQGHADAGRLLQDGLAGLLRARGQPDMYVLRAQEVVRRSGVATVSEP